MEKVSIAKNLIYQRKLKGYTQEELSERTTVTVRTIQRIEKGEVNPHLQTIKLLALGLEISLEDLMVLENPKEETVLMKWLLLMHGTPILGFMLPLCNILFPLFLWIHKREDNQIYDQHGRAIINFQITMTILFLLSFIALVTIEGYGFFMFIGVIPYAFIVSIINLIAAMNGRNLYYPLSISFLKKNQKFTPKADGLFLAICGLSLAACTGGRPTSQITRMDKSMIDKDTLTTNIEELIRRAEVHGMAVTVFDDAQITYQETFGYKNFPKKMPLSDTTNMYGASLSKAVFGVLVMKLVEEKVIDLDSPLESYLPKRIFEYAPATRWHDNYSDLATDTLYSKITARMCLNHTTGFPNWRWFEPDRKLRVKFEPGSRYSYSGEGFVYLQVVLEKLLGSGLEELAQEKIFRPLGMKHSAYEWHTAFEKDFAYGHTSEGEIYPKDKDNEPRGGSTLETTAADYSKFLAAVLQGELLRETSWQEIFRPQIRIRSQRQFGPLAEKDSDLNDGIQLSYGLGWGIFTSPAGIGVFKEGHGDGFQHYSILFPEIGKGILIMANSDNGEGIFKALLETAIADVYTPWEWEGYIPFDQ